MEFARVWVYRGKWVVDCPDPECFWTYYAITDTGLPRYLYRCCGDQNGPGCGKPFELIWPPLDVAEEIVDILSERSLLATRNWTPNETVEHLLAENDAALVGRDLQWLAENGIGVVN